MIDKSLLVMNAPECCVDCKLCYEYDEGIKAFCMITRETDNEDAYREIKEDYCQCKPEWCPLKPVPEKKIECEFKACSKKCCEHGWNACIDEILEGCKDETD